MAKRILIYAPRFTVRLDDATANDLRVVMIATDRTQADALRHCIRLTARALLAKGCQVPEISDQGGKRD